MFNKVSFPEWEEQRTHIRPLSFISVASHGSYPQMHILKNRVWDLFIVIFSSYQKCQSLSHIQLPAIPWTVAH